MRKFITVKTQFEGYHRYASAPEEVAFLRSNHRHIFIVEATIEVFHNDRELEFILVQRALNQIIIEEIDKSDVGSCEMAADKIYKALMRRYCKYTNQNGTTRDRTCEVSVSEDGENKGTITDIWG